MPVSSIFPLLKTLFRLLDIDAPTVPLQNSVEMHHGGRALSDIREILLDFGVCSKSFRLEMSELTELEAPLIVQIKMKGQEELVVLKRWDQQEVEVVTLQDKFVVMALAEFEQFFTGTCLIPFTDEYSGTQNRLLKKNEKIALESIYKSGMVFLFAISILSLGLRAVYGCDSFSMICILLLEKLLGFWITVQILRIEMNREDGLIQQICSRSDCHKVLHSKAAKPIAGLSMGDLGIVYFGGSLLCMFFVLGQSSDISLLSLLSILTFSALPYTFFSVYYQKRKVKAWCPFCLSVMALLWVEAGIFLLWYRDHQLMIDVETLWSVALCYCLLFGVWIAIRELLKIEKQNIGEHRLVYYVKHNIDFFMSLMYLGRELAPISLLPYIGNRKSVHKIILVLSPSCPSCIKIFRQAIEFVKKHPDLAEISICLKSTEQISAENRVIEWMLSAFLCEGMDAMIQVHEIWAGMEDKNIDLFEAHTTTAGFERLDKATNLHRQTMRWVHSSEVNTTPTLIYNRKIIPLWYLFSDLITLIIRMEHENY